MNRRDEEQLRLLTIFHYVCAGMIALCACVPIIHIALGFSMILRPEVFGPARNQPPAFIGWMFMFIGGLIVLFGWTIAALLAVAGRCLSQRRHYTFCLVAAGAACLFMPFGRVLGVFTIVVLTRTDVKNLFEKNVPPAYP
ncbi:MAG TPA: hypothetical protein VFW05_05000 [Verrucomicrobiae bacterium]|nr:hypothetical protein [Verrucomicrobiae bacterium]